MENLTYYSKYSYALKRLIYSIGFMVLAVAIILVSVNKGQVFVPIMWGVILILNAFRIFREDIPSLKRRAIFQITDKAIIYHNKSYNWDNIDEFIIDDTDVISVMIIERPRPKYRIGYIGIYLRNLFYRGGITINTKELDVKPRQLLSDLNERLGTVQGQVAQ